MVAFFPKELVYFYVAINWFFWELELTLLLLLTPKIVFPNIVFPDNWGWGFTDNSPRGCPNNPPLPFAVKRLLFVLLLPKKIDKDVSVWILVLFDGYKIVWGFLETSFDGGLLFMLMNCYSNY